MLTLTQVSKPNRRTFCRPTEGMSVGHVDQSIWILPQQQLASEGVESIP